MTKIRLAFALFFLVLVIGASPQSATDSRIGHASNALRPHSPDHVVVKIAPGTNPDRVLRGTSTRHLFGDWYQVAVLPGENPESTLHRFASKDGVSKVELDYLLSVGPLEVAGLATSGMTALFTPDDEHWGLQWNMTMIGMEEAWTHGTGMGVTIAVVDSGVSSLGSDLDCHTYRSPYNALTGMSGPGVAEDDFGHGTHVAGTSQQCTNNGIGVAGIAYQAELMPIKTLDASGNGSDGSWTAAGINWAVDHGADVINLSLGGTCDAGWPECSADILNEAIDHAVANDVLVIAAAGNQSLPFISLPANHPDAIPASAVDMNQERAWYSNYDQSRLHTHLLAAPGGDLSQTFMGQPAGVLQETLATFCGGTTGTLFCFVQGTSMATPHVAGAVAILRGLHPEATRDEVIQALEDSTLDLGTPGYDPFFGHGLLQVDQAIVALDDLLGPTEPFTCIPGENVLCISVVDETFEVTMDWEGFNQGQGGKAKAVDFSALGITLGGGFHFGNIQNPEVLVKFPKWCDLAGSTNYAVFYAATTNVGFTIRVRQASTGFSEVYSNSLGQTAPPVIDTQTQFPCP